MIIKKTFLVIFFCFSFLNVLHSQETKIKRNPQFRIAWNEPIIVGFGNELQRSLLNFDGAVYYEKSDLPAYYVNLDVIKSNTIPRTKISNEIYEDISPAELILLSGYFNDLSENINLETKIVYEQKKPFLSLKFIPIRINKQTGKYERLLFFDIEYDYDKSQLLPLILKSQTYASNSVLKTGDWYRFNVSQTGIHIITYNNLVTLGINPASIDPRNIRIYGNGGTMLSENNAVYKYDDLQENAIFIYGENDGVFNSGDYILFYAKGPSYWIADTINKIYRHQINKYSVTSAYFITTSLGTGKRIQSVSGLSLPADYVVTEFDDFAFHELDSVNLIKSGREFYGELFDVKTSYSFDFNFPNAVPSSVMKLNTSLLARSVGYSTSFKIFANSTNIATVPISACSPSYTAPYANISISQNTINPINTLNIRIDYNKGANSSAIGWLDYIEINAKRNLSFVYGQLPFRNMSSIGKGITEFIVGNTNSNTIFWDVTNFIDPKRINVTLNGSNSQFRFKTDSLMDFVAFDGSSFYSISPVGKIPNQNLHGLPQTDMIIVSYPDFIGQAERIANMHRNQDNLSVIITTPNQIYNEFSSGNQDVTAIKHFMKMFYDRAGTNTALQPKYLLLFGDASYDFLNRVPDNTNFVPIYQTENSLDPTSSFATDDYFAFLDDFESGAYGNLMDLSVGRLSVKTIEDATAITNKILNYTANSDLALSNNSCAGYSGTISNFGDWRNVVCLVADDNDGGENFLAESEVIAKLIDTVYCNYNLDKIYLDAFLQVSTPGGQRSAECNDAINKRVEKGALIINYIGHGGEIGWAHESILGVSDINNWSNRYNTPMFITATCEFSRCDDPGRISAGEYVLINPNGGGVALFTTSRLAWSGSNSALNTTFFKYVFEKISGNYYRMGEVVKKSKNSFGCPSVISNFLLLGDPALKLAYPKFNVVTSSINNQPLAGISDTLKALSKVTIKGYIADVNGVKQTNFNGIIIPIVFDKQVINTTLGSDGPPQQFNSQKNIVFKGKITVSNGDFSFTFVVPKDIVYAYGKGKISYYSSNGNMDANGYYKNFIVGGNSNNPITDNIGPEIKIYLNDTRFVSGGVTSKDPVLLTYLSDSAGLNTVGNGIGHDIAAVLDDITEKTYVLNDYYESELNTYQKGIIKYPFKNLSTGSHKLKIKAWDVYNNSSESEIEFVVAESAELALTHVLNYPNPFTTYTEFWFEHNQPCCGLDVQIQIFTITGKLVKTISTNVETNGFRADPIPWDGTDDFGDRIGKGVYIYKLRVKSNKGLYADKIEKLVLLK